MKFIRENYDLILFPAGVVALAGALYATNIAPLNPLEFTAVLGVIISRLLLKRERVSGQFFGLVANTVFIFYFLQINLAGQVVLSIFYIMLNIAGIYSWLLPNAKTKKLVRPGFLGPYSRIGIITIAAAAAVFGMVTRGAVGALDYFLMATGIIGMTLLVRKRTDAWASFAAGDAAGLFLFWISGSYLMLATMFVYLYNDTAAFFRWRGVSRKLRKK